jgi:hypothetical protein
VWSAYPSSGPGVTADERLDMQRHVSPAVGVSPRLNSLAFASNNCNAGSAEGKPRLNRANYLWVNLEARGRLQSFEAKAHEFSRGMKPTAGRTLIVSTFVGCDTESEVRIRTLRGGR